MTKELGQNNRHIQTLFEEVRGYRDDLTTGRLEIIIIISSKMYTRIDRDGPEH